MTVKYPKQLEELAQGYQEFFSTRFQIARICKSRRTFARSSRWFETKRLYLLKTFELDRADAQLEQIQLNLDGLYEIFEAEYKARRDVAKNASIIKDYIAHTRANNKNLLWRLIMFLKPMF